MADGDPLSQPGTRQGAVCAPGSWVHWCLVTCPQPAPMEGTDGQTERRMLAGHAAAFRGARGHTLGWEGSLRGGIENHLRPAAGEGLVGATTASR